MEVERDGQTKTITLTPKKVKENDEEVYSMVLLLQMK